MALPPTVYLTCRATFVQPERVTAILPMLVPGSEAAASTAEMFTKGNGFCFTLILNEQCALPEEFDAVQFTVVMPIGKLEPEGGEQTMVPQRFETPGNA